MKIKSYFFIEEKCEDDEKLILRSMSHAMVVLSRAWGHFNLVRTPRLRQLRHESGKIWKRRESAEKTMLARVPPNSCLAHRVGPVLSAPQVHTDEERDRK